uniref:Uncharacterized protein n=1 Tax=Zea mays TaxID=4577 RepID=C0HIR8_MAIZE|nr:unknown [Zea mays]
MLNTIAHSEACTVYGSTTTSLQQDRSSWNSARLVLQPMQGCKRVFGCSDRMGWDGMRRSLK